MKSSLNIFIFFSSLVFCLCAVNELNDETFDDHIAIGNNFVAFYAPWCGHSRRLEPAWEELAEVLENDPSVSISRVDCDEFGESICDNFDVDSYPTLLWIVDGEEVDKYDGERDVEEFKAYIEEKTGVHIGQFSVEEYAEYAGYEEYEETSDDHDPEESDEEETTTVQIEQSSEDDYYTEYKEASDDSDAEESSGESDEEETLTEETTTVHIEQSSEEKHAGYEEYEETSDDSDPEELDEEETSTAQIEQSSEDDYYTEYKEASDDSDAAESSQQLDEQETPTEETTTVHIEQSSEEEHTEYAEYEETFDDNDTKESDEEESEIDDVTHHLDPIDEFFLIVPTSYSVVDLNSETFQNHISVGNHFVAFLHPLRPSSRRLEAVCNELANSLQDDRSVSFSRYNCNDRLNYRLCLNILRPETFPAFVWFVDGRKVDVYDGVIGVDELKAYIKRKTTANSNGISETTSVQSHGEEAEVDNDFVNSTTESPQNVTMRMSSGGNVCNLKETQIWLCSMFLLLLTRFH